MSRGDAGISVAELLVVLSILGFVITTMFLVANSASKMSDSTQALSQAREKAMRALDMISREWREAQSIQTTDNEWVAVEVAQPRRCSFYVDKGHDQDVERVTYFIEDGALYRSYAEPDSDGFAPDGPKELVLDQIDPEWSDAMFTYSTEATQAAVLADPQNHLTDIDAVRVEVGNVATVGTRPRSARISTFIKLRSMNDPLTY